MIMIGTEDHKKIYAKKGIKIDILYIFVSLKCHSLSWGHLMVRMQHLR